MRLRRVLAVAVVCGSACGVFDAQLTSETTQEVAIVNTDNPWVFTSQNEAHQFFVKVLNSTDNDNITSIHPTNNQLCPNFVLSTPGLPTPQHICGINASFDGPGLLGCPKSYTFTVTYIGNSNNESCELDIDWVSIGSAGSGSGSGSGSGVANLDMSSSIVVPSMTVSPTSHDFGQLGFNTTSSPTTVTVTNSGTIPLTISGSLGGAGATAYTVTPLGGASLASHVLNPGLAEQYDVTCTPPMVHVYVASFDFASLEGGLMRSTSLLCEGIDSTIAISPSQVQFPSTLVGRAPLDQQVMVTSAGAPGGATLESVTLDAMAQQNEVTIVSAPAVGTLVSSGFTVKLAYAATKVFDTGTLGKLLIKVTSDATPRQVGISGEALLGAIGTNPQKIDLGPVCISGTAAVVVEVYANAPGTINLSRPVQPAAPFSYTTTDTFPVTLKGNHIGPSAMLSVAISQPTAIGDGSATLSLPTDIPNAPPYDVQVAATVIAAGIAATPGAVHFGSVDPNGSTSGREVKLTNCGTTDLQVTRAQIIGNDANEFAIVAPTDPAATLKPTERETFVVIMAADKVVGDKQATLHIDYAGGSAESQLDGTVSGSTPRETYYGCDVATGGSSAAFVIGASLFARRRRRSRERSA